MRAKTYYLGTKKKCELIKKIVCSKKYYMGAIMHIIWAQ